MSVKIIRSPIQCGRWLIMPTNKNNVKRQALSVSWEEVQQIHRATIRIIARPKVKPSKGSYAFQL